MILNNYNDFMKASKYFHQGIWYYRDNTIHPIRKYFSHFQVILFLMKLLYQPIQYYLPHKKLDYYNLLKQSIVIKKILLF